VKSRLAAAALLLTFAACSTHGGNSVASTPTPSGADVTIPVASPGAATATTFDAAHVASILLPAVGEVLVTLPNDHGIGSGFVVARQGGTSYMVTNNHVVQNAVKLVVLMPDGRHFTVKVQGTDPIQDIAVLSIDDGTLPVATFGDSTRLVVGQPVVAIGSPYANESTVTSGIISALHRTITTSGANGVPAESLPDVLQTDAPINPGNSGGPLADADGNVVGVNTAGGTTGIGFAIPSLIAKRIATDLIAGRKPGHPYLGVCFQDESSVLAAGHSMSGYGVLVTKAIAGTPAATAGLQANDVIEQVDGVDLNNGQTLGGVIQLYSPGDTVKLTVLRSGSKQTIPLTLGDRPSSAPSSSCTTP
jgi:S1-C subfamily serine protease